MNNYSKLEKITTLTTFKYKPDGRVLKEFMRDDSFFRGLRGPVGSGKSVACCIEVIRRALLQKPSEDGKRKSRWAVIRNTNPQLKTTTIKTIPKNHAKYKCSFGFRFEIDDRSGSLSRNLEPNFVGTAY